MAATKNSLKPAGRNHVLTASSGEFWNSFSLDGLITHNKQQYGSGTWKLNFIWYLISFRGT